LNCSLLESMACMHSYYVSNTKDEIKSAYQELNETEFEQVVIQSNLHFSELINVDDEELQNVLGIKVSVVIPPYEIIEHGDPEFDVESIVDNLMTRRSKGSNQNNFIAPKFAKKNFQVFANKIFLIWETW
ncbi:12481_t:CDS:2, partial [Entrophospora sp. SA101]